MGLQENHSQRLGVPQDGETRFLIPGLTLAGQPSVSSAPEQRWVEHYLSLLGESSEGEGFPVSGRWESDSCLKISRGRDPFRSLWEEQEGTSGVWLGGKC